MFGRTVKNSHEQSVDQRKAQSQNHDRYNNENESTQRWHGSTEVVINLIPGEYVDCGTEGSVERVLKALEVACIGRKQGNFAVLIWDL